jgi:hypothetical protein
MPAISSLCLGALPRLTLNMSMGFLGPSQYYALGSVDFTKVESALTWVVLMQCDGRWKKFWGSAPSLNWRPSLASRTVLSWQVYFPPFVW